MRLQHCHYTSYVFVTRACVPMRRTVLVCVRSACVQHTHYASCHLVQFIKLPLYLIGPVSPLPSLHPVLLLLLLYRFPFFIPLSALAALTALRRLHRGTRGWGSGCARWLNTYTSATSGADVHVHVPIHPHAGESKPGSLTAGWYDGINTRCVGGWDNAVA